MTPEEYRKYAHEMVDWIADYLETVQDLPVRSNVQPGDVINQLPTSAPETGEPFDAIFADFQTKIMPGITHWQHPRFFGFFPANVSEPSMLAEMLVTAMGTNAMLWETSPAATELEERMMQWLARLMQLPETWSGVIQDTASSATFVACLMARERATRGASNEVGLMSSKPLVIYASPESHSSIEKAAKMAGYGRLNVRYTDPSDEGGMDPRSLKRLIKSDRDKGLLPAMIVATVGSTSTGAADPLREIAEIAGAEDLFLHVDAAWAGSAMICPEYRDMLDGVELADSYVFNPHKWMLVNFDCSAHFVRDKAALIRTLSINPAYLQTAAGGQVNDYRDWGIQLGRRFRALKLWFVLRSYGAEAIRDLIRNHVNWAHDLAEHIVVSSGFELVTEPRLAMFTFRPSRTDDSDEATDLLTDQLVAAVNDGGQTYLTRTIIDGRPAIRFQIGQTKTTWEDVQTAWAAVAEMSEKLSG